MSDLQRQHPAAALANAFDIVRSNFITILVLIFIGGGGQQANFTLYWILGTFIVLLIWGLISWYRFEFRVQDGELQIEQGVVIHKKLYLTSDRIQVIDISAGVVQRLFGLVAVEVKTAGSSSKEAKINAITREKAEQLKRLLRKENKSENAEASEGLKQSQVYTLNTGDLLVAASTSGRLGVALSVVGALFSQIEQIISEEQMIRFVENHLPNTTSTTMVLLSIAAVIVVSWVFAFLGTIVKYYDFVVEVRENELLIERGLFERTQLTIPFNRIQAVQIKEELLRQPLGYASLVIESAGYGEEQANSTTLFPLISKYRIYEFINEVIPEYHADISETTGASQRGLRRYLLRMVWVSLPVILTIWGTVTYGVYAWFLLIPALLLGYQQYRDAQISKGDNTIILTSRLLSKTTAIIKRYRTQACEIRENPFQTRLQLSNFTVHVASGNQGRSFTVRELAKEDSSTYLNWLANGNSTSILSDDKVEEKEEKEFPPSQKQ